MIDHMREVNSTIEELGVNWKEIVIALISGGNTWKLSEQYGIKLSTLRHAQKLDSQILAIVYIQESANRKQHLSLVA